MKNRIFIFLTASILLGTSCNDWLDVKPKTQEPAKEMFETLEGYQDALIGCYIKMKDKTIYGRDMTMTVTEYMAQHWDVYTSSVGSETNTLATAVKAYKYDDDNVKTVFKDIYGGLYNIIVQTNTILEALPKTGETAIKDEQMRGIIEAEARAIRAYCHFDILRLFGQVPGGSMKVKLPYTEGVSRDNVKYHGFEEYVEKLEYDLKEAERLLEEHDPFMVFDVRQVNALGGTPRVEEDFYKYRQHRMNYFAVKALQARLYLYIGNRDSDALASARTVIKASKDGKGFKLGGNGNINAGFLVLPDEGLFMLSNHQLKSYVGNLFPGYSTNPTTGTNLYMSPDKLTEMFGESLSATAGNRYNKLWSHDKKNPQADNCPELRKYYQGDDVDMGKLDVLLYKQLVPMLRLSEMYLIVMELSNDAAELNDLYFDYRKARDFVTDGLTFTMDQIKAVVEAEYRREFFGEGQMFYYYKRNFTSNMMWASKAMTENNYIVPLPDTEFDPNL